jgi:hypothetical protein
MTDLEQLCNELQTQLNITLSEVRELKAGKKTSAPKARKSLQALKIGSHALRGHITEFQKAMPVKSRIRKEPDAPATTQVAENLSDNDEGVGLPDPPPLEREETSDIAESSSVPEPVAQPAARVRARKRAR